MTTPCSNTQQLSGPFNQTLFLGCTVVNMDMNLGWGGETSSCRLTLIKDLYEHHNSPSMLAYKNLINNRFQNPNLNNENINNNENADLPYHQNIISKEKEKWDKVLSNDINNMDDAFKDLGKHCWKTYRSNIRNRYDNPNNPALIRYIGKDPGFIGDFSNNNAGADFDIAGCPVFFRFADIWFGGMIKNWKFNSNKYEVELNSFSSLLKGCKLILQKYYGTISTVINNTSTALSTGQNLAVPYLDVAYPCGENIDCRNNSMWPKYQNRYNASIYQGNIPNLFNVFGYLENRSFGSSGFIEGRGVSAGRIYDGIVQMLGSSSDRRNNENVFNPYGAIVAKTPFNRTNNTLFNPHTMTYTDNDTGQLLTLTEMGLIYTPIAVDQLPRSLFALDLTEVPRPPYEVYLNEDSMDLIGFIDFCCQNAGLEYLIEFEPNDIESGNSSYSGVIRIKTVTRNVQPAPNTIRSLVFSAVEQQNVVSYNFGEEYQDTNTRSVLVGGPQERLHQITTHTGGQMGWWQIFEPAIESWVDITSFANTSTQNNSLYNTYREPDHANQRPIGNNDDPFRVIAGAAVAQENNNFAVPQTSVYGVSNINKGSYLTIKKPTLNTNTILPGNSYPLYLDLISPYFGKSNNNEYRRVYLDRKTGQLQIIMDFRDIQIFFPTQYDINTNGDWGPIAEKAQSIFPGVVLAGDRSGDTPGGSVAMGKFVVEEDELRAAMADQEQWERHRVNCLNWGRPTAITKIIFNYLTRTISGLFAQAHIGLLSTDKNSYDTYLRTVDRFYSANLMWYRDGRGRTWHEGLNAFGSTYAFASRVYRPELNIFDYQETMPSINKLFTDIWSFLNQIANTHYGKTFAVRLPELKRYASSSSGDTVFNYSIANDAWEEPGNTIDDTMESHSLAANFLKSENGKIPPLLAFDNSAEYDVPNNIFNSMRQDLAGNLRPGFLSPYAHRNRSLATIGVKNTFRRGTTRNRGALNDPWAYYQPLIHRLPSDSYIELPYIGLLSDVGPPGGRPSFSPILNTSTAHNFNRDALSHLYKTYTKAQILPVEENSFNPQITFAVGTPRAVLSTPSPVFIRSNYNFGMTAIIAEIAIGDEEPAEVDVINYPIPRRSYDALEMLLMDTRFFDDDAVNPRSIDINSGLNLRAAKPVFAAIPLRYNLATYGPWISHPGLIAENIFPGRSTTSEGLAALVNNIVGGVDIQIDSGLVPWEYGGMIALDNAALLKVQNNEYQQVLETGDITLAGIMLRNWNLGSYLLGTFGPIVTSIKINIGDNGMTTTYGLRSFSRKLGFYNKEQADNIKNNNLAMLKQNQRMANMINDMQRRLKIFASQPQSF
jgi:hypothetical protein